MLRTATLSAELQFKSLLGSGAIVSRFPFPALTELLDDLAALTARIAGQV
jgi:hypothetical protein